MNNVNSTLESNEYLDIENSLLSELVRDNNNYYYVSFLKSAYFLDPINQKIFNSIEYLINSDRVADVIHILSYLKADDSFKDNELTEYVKNNISNSSVLGTVFNMGNIILNTYLKRQLKTKLTQEVNEIDNVSFFQIKERISQIEESIFELSNISSKKTNSFVSINSSISHVVDNFKKAFNNDEMIHGVASGFKAIDNIINGFNSSDLIILAARPSMGKTSLALNIAYNVAKNKSKNKENSPSGVGFFSLEMSSDQIASRIISMKTDFNTYNIKTARVKNESTGKNTKINKSSYDNFIKIVKDFDNLPIYLNDTPAISVANISSNARRLKNKYNIELIIIDYLQLIKADSHYKGNRVQEISSISQSLKSLAKELDIPIIALSQLSRGVEARENKRPLLSDLRESGSIEQDADIVMFVYRDKYYKLKESEDQANENQSNFVGKIENDDDEAEIIVSKNRNGPTGSNKLLFIKEKTLFQDIDVKKTLDSHESIKKHFSNEDEEVPSWG